jgi:formate hydrogenlyase subunit 3/multisubunit Na+/H+ antiporter MnhD subunit
MLSMAGMPPFIGFYAKLLILQQVIYKDNANFIQKSGNNPTTKINTALIDKTNFMSMGAFTVIS